MPPHYNAVINHPVQIGWFETNRAQYESRQTIDRLSERFADTGEDMARLLGDLALAGIRTDVNRITHENASRHALVINDYELATYTEIAGRPERVGKLVDWFCERAYDFFDRTQHDRKPPMAVGLELGGMTQAGDWSGTGPLDAMANSLPDQVLVEDSRAQVAIRTGKAIHKGYSMEPLNAVRNGAYYPDFPYALVRRRRSAADIVMHDRLRAEVKKEAVMMVAVNQLFEDDRHLVRNAYGDWSNFEANNAKNSTTAGVLGRVVEQAIREEREASTAVIPVSAHYYVTAKRPAELS